jgi:hypothetical protein
VVSPKRSVPLTFDELTAALRAGVFPRERSWIDFKRRLYPEGDDAASGSARERVSQELSRDMASMAELGGFLVYGVREDKINHAFVVDEMPLPVGLHETADAIARDRITPPLTVVPSLVPNPANRASGLLVVEIPESPDSPHMVDFTYWGRSETGRVRLGDERVERLIMARARRDDQLSGEMRATVEADPLGGSPQQMSHFYFTAVPTQGWPDMFAEYTRDAQGRLKLLQLCSGLAEKIRQADGQRPSVAYAGLHGQRRTQQPATSWLATWADEAHERRGDRTVGIDDDGPIRYINLGAVASLAAAPQVTMVFELQLMHETHDMARLVATLAERVGYVGSWLLGVELNLPSGHVSQLADDYLVGRFTPTDTFGAARYLSSTRASALELRDKPGLITSRLMRRLLRGLGSEELLSQPHFNED